MSRSFALSLQRGALHLVVAAAIASVACSSDHSTPSDPSDPARPSFSAPQPIEIGQTIGAATFAPGDSAAGGQGQTVRGIACDGAIPVQHIHAHLTLIADGVQRAIPLAVGTVGSQVISNFVVDAHCFYWLHTHDATGIIHVEAPVSTQFTLGDFFAIWGEPLSRANVAGFTGSVTAYVDSTRYDGDLGALGFEERQQITLIVGSVPAELPLYEFPSVF
jgi:hypothetical protein